MKKLRINHNEKGFTLIELMIVIAIIGILAAIAIPNFIAYRDKAFCSSGESDANAILSSVSDFYAIPAHVTITAGGIAIGTAGGAIQIDGADTADVPRLSGTNTATLFGPVNSIYVVVTDGSARCSQNYRDAGVLGAPGPPTIDGWTQGAVAPFRYYKGMQ